MNRWPYALVIGFLAGVVYTVLGYIFTLNQTWSPIVAVIVTVVARYIQEKWSPLTNVSPEWAFVIAAIQVIAALIVVALLFQPAMGIGLPSALTVGILLFVVYFLTWLVVELLVEVLFLNRGTARTSGR